MKQLIFTLLITLFVMGCSTTAQLNNIISYTLHGNDSTAIVKVHKNKTQILSLLNPLLPWSDDFSISKSDTLKFEIICRLPHNMYSEFKLNGQPINPLEKYWIDKKGIHKKYIVTL